MSAPISHSEILSAIAHIAAGKTGAAAGKAIGRDWESVIARIRANAEYSKLYIEARDHGVEAQVDSLADIAENEPDVARARLKTEVIRWTASKRKPQVYGDKIEMNVSGSVDLNAIMAESVKRLRPVRDLAIEDATLVPVVPSLSGASPTDTQSGAPDIAALLE